MMRASAIHAILSLFVCGMICFGLSSCGDKATDSSDGGPRGWIAQANLPTARHLNAIHATDSNTAIAVGDSGTILTTPDGVATWARRASGYEAYLRGVHFPDSENGWTVGYGGVILRTADSGSTWVTQASGLTTGLRDLFFVDADTGWVCGGPWGSPGGKGVILKTTDGGDNWSMQASGTAERLWSVYFVNSGAGYAAGESGTILKTPTGGES